MNSLNTDNKIIADQSKYSQKLIWVLKGIILGIATLIPGLSASTLAIIMGIYEKSIVSITNTFSIRPQKSIKRIDNIIFLAYLSIGIGIAIITCIRWLPFILTNYHISIYSLFTGLIIGSLPSLFLIIKKTFSSIALIIASTCIFFSLSLFFTESLPHNNYPSLLLFLVSGFISFSACLLPGFSGATTLLILGMYQFVLQSLQDLIWTEIGFFILGGVLGLICTIYFIQLLFKTYKEVIVSIMIGIIIGSLSIVFPWIELKSEIMFSTVLNSIIFIIIGMLIFFLIHKLRFFNRNHT